MRIEPFRVFWGLALVSLLGLSWATGSGMALVFFYAALSAWIWNLIPVWLEGPLPKMTEIFPAVMLLLFMLLIAAIPVRATSEALFHTAAALVLFRGIIYALLRIRESRSEIPVIVKAALAGFLLELVLNAIQIYATFRPVSLWTHNAVASLSIRGLMLILTLGWVLDRRFDARERRYGVALALAIVGNPYWAGALLMVNTFLFLKGKGFRYHD